MARTTSEQPTPEDMCHGCIHEQKNYNGQIESQKHVYVFQNTSAVTDTGCVCVCACVLSVHAG